ncbi:hypothetical protein [Spirulina major]|uniref:hypothetical protein n=1 Tax=Spirulina major TaxID=270636 RepID=UPI001114F568|nr:hypothetical protein [Spirulina major]
MNLRRFLGITSVSLGLLFGGVAQAEVARSHYREISPQDYAQRYGILGDTPQATALELFADLTRETEGRQSESVRLDYDAHGGAIATVTVVGLADDSIAAIRLRLEFVWHHEYGWQLIWVGQQQRCRRGESQEWTAALCP